MSVHSGGFFSSIVTVPYSFMSHSLLYWPVHARLSVSVDERKKKAGEEWNSKRAKNGGKIIQVLYTWMPYIDAHSLRQQLPVWFEPKNPVAKLYSRSNKTDLLNFIQRRIRIMFTCQNIGAISLTLYFRQNNFSAGVSSFRIGQIYIMFRVCKFLSANGLEDKFQSHLPLKIKIEENRKYAAGTVFVH